MKRISRCAFVSLAWMLGACGSSSSESATPPATGGPAPGTGGSSASPGSSGGGGAGAGAPAGGPSTGVGQAVEEMLCGSVPITAQKIVAAGKTVSVCAGTVLTFSSDAALVVQGTLKVQGTAESPVKFVGAQANPGAWIGIVVSTGGSISASNLEIHDAAVAIDAKVGSTFQIDHILVANSSSLLNLAADGTLSHGQLHGLSADQQGSPVFIDSASPHIVDTVIDKGLFGGVDMVVVVGATAAPVFDHVEVADSHCAFHANEGSGIAITNSYVHHNAYGIMMGGATGGTISHSNFQDNSVNIGTCSPGASAQVVDDYFAGQPFDGSCLGLALGNPVATPYTSDVGPRP